MSHIHLNAFATQLQGAWKSAILAKIGGANLKVLRMDGTEYPDEVHDYPEGLLVLTGELKLTVEGVPVRIGQGEIYVVPPGVSHGVQPGSSGTLIIFDV